MSTHDIPRCSVETNVIRMLGDNPNTDNNLSAEQLKAKFDQAPEGIVAYLNNEMLPHTQGKIEIIGLLKSDGTGKVAEAVPGVDYQIPMKADSVTTEMLGNGVVTPEKLSASFAAPSSSSTATLTVEGWADKKQTVTNIAGVTADNHIVISPASNSYVVYAENMIRCIEQAEGSLTFQCEDVPDAAVTVNILIVG